MGDIFLCLSPGMVLIYIVLLLIHSVDVVVYHSCGQRVLSQVNVVVWQKFSCEISTDLVFHVEKDVDVINMQAVHEML